MKALNTFIRVRWSPSSWANLDLQASASYYWSLGLKKTTGTFSIETIDKISFAHLYFYEEIKTFPKVGSNGNSLICDPILVSSPSSEIAPR